MALKHMATRKPKNQHLANRRGLAGLRCQNHLRVEVDVVVVLALGCSFGSSHLGTRPTVVSLLDDAPALFVRHGLFKRRRLSVEDAAGTPAALHLDISIRRSRKLVPAAGRRIADELL